MLKYQGRIAVNGVNFEGNGQFKFALVNGDGSSTYWSNDGTTSGEPASAVTLPVVKGLYDALLGDAPMTPIPASVFNNPDVRLRVWFNDGVNGFEQLGPDERIASVGYTMVAGTVPDGSITASKLAPGVGDIPDGSITADKLAPGAAAGNLSADNLSAVPVGGIIASADPANQALLDQGYAPLDQAFETPDRWTEVFAGEAPAGHSAVWTGTEAIFWGGHISDGDSTNGRDQDINRGVRYNPTTETWTPVSTVGAPSPRRDHVATWTGSKMIVWGGQREDPSQPIGTYNYFNDGGIYDPATDTWTPLSTTNAPSPRVVNQAVWTGSKMVVFGGFSTDAAIPTYLNDGGFYDPSTDSWASFTAPWTEPRTGSIIAWTGSSLIVWDSQGPSPETPRGGRYFPGTDSWATIARIPGEEDLTVDGPTVVWTGTQMILWSGQTAPGFETPTGGYIYTLGSNTWSAMSTTNAPLGATDSTVVWTGSKMVVWGGYTSNSGPPPINGPSNTGGVYDPSTDGWIPMSTESPSSRANANADGCWTGTEMIVWGGNTGVNLAFPSEEPVWRKLGGRYNPLADTWTPLANGSPDSRAGHTAVWSGDKVIIWGGQNSLASGTPSADAYPSSGATFDPVTNSWEPMATVDAPPGRIQHTAIWAGGEMLVWGGSAYDEITFTVEPLNTGAHYEPTSNSWLAIGPAATPRSGHAAIWTGTHMIVVGGHTGPPAGPTTPPVAEKYDPITGIWTTLSNQYLDLMGNPSEIFGILSPVAVWTGTEVYVIDKDGGFPRFLRYTPATDTWVQLAEPLPTDGVDLVGVSGLIWMGDRLLITKDGTSPDGSLGAIFDPVAETWSPLNTFGQPEFTDQFPPTNTFQVSSVWTGSKLIFFGGVEYPNPQDIFNPFILPGGGIYDPATDAWVGSLSPTGGPPLGMGSALWLGNEMFLWGGAGQEQAAVFTVYSMTDRGFRYRPPQRLHLYVRP